MEGLMTNDLTKLAPYVEQARTTLTQTAEHERALVQALSEETMRLDKETLQGIRTLTAEHEARRAGILNELQALAICIGTFKGVGSPAEAVAIPRHARPQATYHDELEASLHALMIEGSNH